MLSEPFSAIKVTPNSGIMALKILSRHLEKKEIAPALAYPGIRQLAETAKERKLQLACPLWPDFLSLFSSLRF
jgi:hypothetical protein